MLSNSRTYGFSAPNPISFESMFAWASLMGIKLTPWEVQVIGLLDHVWIDFVMAKEAINNNPESSRPMSPKLFDAIFAGKQ